MQKKTVAVQIMQTVKYAATNEVDSWMHECQAELLELNTFTKLSYLNANQQPTEVKWWIDSQYNQWQASVKQPQGVLAFNPQEITKTAYHTEQGIWEMTVHTHAIRQQWQKDGKQHYTTFIIDYQLRTNNEIIGTYQMSIRYSTK